MNTQRAQSASPRLTRRALLQQSANGFGAVALASILGDDLALGRELPSDPFAPRATDHRPRAKSVIFIYLDGGPSQVDTFDPKPRLTREHGKPFAMTIEPTQFDDNGNTLGSPWKFRKHGESGTEVSDLLPHIAKHVDDMTVIRSMTSNFPEHTAANYFLHTGFGVQGRPSMGAWFGYGLGTECRDLPSFVVLNSGLIPPGGLDNFNSGFLPATYQASIFNPSDPPLANVVRREATEALQRNKLDLLAQLDAAAIEQAGSTDALESAISNYELAYRMQAAAPELADLSQETASTREMYGVDSQIKGQGVFGRQCLIARRLVERGVRFIELTCPNVGHDRWDQHNDLKQGHHDNAMATDRAIGALLTDLKQRGLLEETLVVWCGEFGRTPFAQGSNGRDHNPFGFSIWLAGGGVKKGLVYGQTDEFGYKVIENRVEIHDLHATMLHLLGVDHERLTFRFSGRDIRLTDVHGDVIEEIIA